MWLPVTLTNLLVSWLSTTPQHSFEASTTKPDELVFTLRHQHAIGYDGRNMFSDVSPSLAPETFSLQSRTIKATRPKSFAAFEAARKSSTSPEWEDYPTPGPDLTSRETVLALARMTNNAYFSPGDKGWYDLGDKWGVVCFFATRGGRVRSL